MATTESRSGFRLPWSADRSPARDAAAADEIVGVTHAPGATDPEPGHEAGEEQPTMESPAAVTDTARSAPAIPRAADAPGAAADHAPALGILAGPSAAGSRPATEPAPVRRPTKFLADLTKAMQAAAEAARAASLEQFHAEGKAFVEQVHARSATEAEGLRRRADEDVAGIRDWSKAEIARIREEAELRIAARRGQLEGQLERHAALIEREIEKVRSRTAAYEAEMQAFFDELLREEDPTAFAAHAMQLPEAPAFEEIDEDALAELLSEPPAAAVREPDIGAPVAGVEPVAGVADEPAASAAAAAAGDAEPPMDREAAMAAIQAAAEAAAELEAESTDVGPAESGAAELEATPETTTPAVDPRIAALGLTPDYAAAEAEAASEAVDAAEAYEIGEESLSSRLAGLIPDGSAPGPAAAPEAAQVASTQVVVVGLVSVASIASFKRHLGRLAGVRRVGVSSGPDGEFVFSVDHEPGTLLRELVPTLPGFAARVTGTGDGIVNVAAHDPDN